MAELSDEQIAAAEAAGASSSEIEKIALLKERADLFERAMRKLEEWEPYVVETELEDEWRALLERGYTLRARLEYVFGKVDEAFRWAKGFVGLEGARGQLGAFWLIPVAIIAAAIAAIGWWLADYRKFAKKFEEQQRIAGELREQGVDPIEAERQAASAVAGTVPGWLAPLRGPLGLIALGVGGFVVWRMLGDE